MRYYIASIVLLVLVLLGHIYGSDLGWYTSIPLYDVVMHIAGGCGIGLALFAIYRHGTDRMKIFVRVVSGTLLAGLIWEGFEIAYDIAGYPLWTFGYYVDTAKDLANDIVGSLIAFYSSVYILSCKK
ncbi:MAG: hypothetical protein M1459_01505 [Patescibacteria group bacterium]|nr:hypothetical protein [Patescibacteria group bacterium]